MNDGLFNIIIVFALTLIISKSMQLTNEQTFLSFFVGTFLWSLIRTPSDY